MAHVVSGIPVLVEFRTTPCNWTLKASRKVWEIINKRARRPLRLYKQLGDWLQGVYFDPWSVRTRFLELRTSEEVMGFLAQTGCFCKKLPDGLWGVQDIMAWGDLIRRLLETRPERWKGIVEREDNLKVRALQLYDNFNVRFRWKPGSHIAIFNTDDSLGAMLATVWVDHLHGAKFAFCARPDCKKPYEIASKHKRKFCSEYCGHLQSLRRLRSKRKRTKKGLHTVQ